MTIAKIDNRCERAEGGKRAARRKERNEHLRSYYPKLKDGLAAGASAKQKAERFGPACA